MPSGVLTLAARVDGAPVGFTVSSFINVSLDPALVAVSIRNESSTWPVLDRTKVIGASVLAEPQAEFGMRLARREAKDHFDSVVHSVTDSGAIVIDDAVAWLRGNSQRGHPRRGPFPHPAISTQHFKRGRSGSTVVLPKQVRNGTRCLADRGQCPWR
ncbi:flavin reductase family protein [Rhodococcus triatomae]|nr:putative oxidoreductase [Rhodococcus triatomae BKS 15-14]